MDLQHVIPLVSDLMSAGYNVTASQVSGELNTWQVQTSSRDHVDRQTVDSFASQHSVTVQSYSGSTSVMFL